MIFTPSDYILSRYRAIIGKIEKLKTGKIGNPAGQYYFFDACADGETYLSAFCKYNNSPGDFAANHPRRKRAVGKNIKRAYYKG
jgi:hypothetical protein